MNLSNQKLFKGIKIFFKVAYIFMIVIFCVNILSQGVFLFSNTEHVSTLSIFQAMEKPDITMNIAGKAVQPEAIFGIGGIVIKGVPTLMKVSNAVSMLIGLFLFIIILKTIRSIIKSIGQGEVFSMLNAQRLKKTGILLLINLVFSYSVTLMNSFSIQTFSTSSIVSFIGMVIGEASGDILAIVFIFFVAAIFKIGVNIQEENQSFV
jgi:hypothetical protein